MEGSPSGIVSLGFGSWGSVGMIVTLGFGTGATGPLIFKAFQCDSSGVYASEIDANGFAKSQSVAIGPEQAAPVVNTSTFG